MFIGYEGHRYIIENDAYNNPKLMRCGWDVVVLVLELTLCWNHEIHIHEFLVSLQEFKMVKCLAMLIEL